MEFVKDQKLIELANRWSWVPKDISVLNQEKLGEYCPLVQLIESQLSKKLSSQKLILPEMRKDGNDSIGVFSDYGGESKDSRYFTYSFLIFGWNHSYGLGEKMQEVRAKFGLGDKEISFKDLAYGPVNRGLDEYLRALDFLVNGLLLTVVVDKSVGTLFGDGQKIPAEIIKVIDDAGFGSWKPAVAEKLLRVVHTAAYFIALLSKSGQKILWMTDHDAIAPNPNRITTTLSLFDNILRLYTDNEFEIVGGAVPFEERSVMMLDLLSASYITAGAIEHYLTRRDLLDDLTVKKHADKVLKWLCHEGIGLKKFTILIKKDSSSFTSAEIEFNEVNPSEHAKFVPIYV